MSYIRALTNPEELYIWEQAENDGRTTNAYLTCKALGERLVHVPSDRFARVLRDFKWNQHKTEWKYRDLSLRERPDFRYELMFPGWPFPIVAYEVTWMYVANHM